MVANQRTSEALLRRLRLLSNEGINIQEAPSDTDTQLAATGWRIGRSKRRAILVIDAKQFLARTDWLDDELFHHYVGTIEALAAAVDERPELPVGDAIAWAESVIYDNAPTAVRLLSAVELHAMGNERRNGA